MAVPHIFENKEPPIDKYSIDAEKVNENFQSICSGTALEDKVIKNRHIDDKAITINQLADETINSLQYGFVDSVDTYSMLPDPANIDEGTVYAVKNDEGTHYAGLYRVEVDNNETKIWVFKTRFYYKHGSLDGLDEDDHPQYLHLDKTGQEIKQDVMVAVGKKIDGVDISEEVVRRAIFELLPVRNSVYEATTTSTSYTDKYDFVGGQRLFFKNSEDGEVLKSIKVFGMFRLKAERGQITDEVIGTGNGSDIGFSGTLNKQYIIGGLFSVTYTIGGVQYEGNDDGEGNIIGTSISSGTINYDTGDWTITFDTPPDDGTNILASYTYGKAWARLKFVANGIATLYSDEYSTQSDDYVSASSEEVVAKIELTQSQLANIKNGNTRANFQIKGYDGLHATIEVGRIYMQVDVQHNV